MKILHLDDHLLFAEGLSAVLTQQDQSLQVVSVEDTQKAIDVLEQQQDVDLIFIDLNLPGLDGFAFIEALGERQIFTPFIILSASENLWDIRKALSLGAAGYMAKTATSQEILATIESVMQGNICVPQALQEALARLPEKEPSNDKQKVLSAYQLGQRQMDVLRLMQQGYSTDEIAKVLNLSRNTIKTHTRTLFTSFEVKNRLECVRYAERIGLLS